MKKLLGFAIFWGEKSSQVKFANYLTVGRSGFTKSRFSEQQSRCAEAWEIIRFGANSHGTKKSIGVTCEQDFITAILSRFDNSILVYFVMQILAALLAMPFAMLYSYAVSGTIDGANTIALAPSMLLGFVGMGGYLWKKGYLKDDGKMWSPVSVPYLGWSIIIGFATIFLIDFVMSKLSFLPDWLGNTFDLLQSGWLGILCISVLGPILEEMLFRGAITKVLLRKYNPVKAIILSALIFGIFHINPAQVVGATLSGILFAWLYYKTGSLVPGILIHILNNGLSVFLSLYYPDVEYTSDLLGEPAYWICLAGAVVLFAVSYRVMNSYRLPD